MAVYPVRILSVCAGAGGLDLGVSLALPDARTVCYIEREGFAVQHLVALMAQGRLDEAPIWSDVKTFRSRDWRGAVDCVIAGIPCQPYSTAGKRRGAQDDRNLWPYLRDIIRDCEPRWVFLENVPGIRKYYFDEIAPDLCRMGYGTQEGLFSAAEVGAPQRRQRFFALGYRDRRHLDFAAGHLDGQVFHPPGWAEGADGTASSSRDVAHADGEQQWRALPVFARRPCESNAYPRRTGNRVEDARSVAQDGHIRQWQLASGAAGQGIFPPGPDDADGWASMLRAVPSLKPSLCRVADGSAAMLDRFHKARLIGNSVVPMVAAVALRTLAHHALHGNAQT